MNKEIVCINCPIGCRITVRFSESGSVISVSGNSCIRGERYARQECISPVRTVTAVMLVEGSSVPLSVKTSEPVPRDKIFEIMDVLHSVSVKTPVSIGDIIVYDVCGTGSNIVATRNLPSAAVCSDNKLVSCNTK